MKVMYLHKINKIFFLIAFCITLNISAQKVSNKLYQSTLKVLLSHTVPEIEVSEAQLRLHKAIFLDARKFREYKVSHIPLAKYVGYGDFNNDCVKSIAKNEEIIVYCSVGYRSEKIAKKLLALGFTNVHNLYGGLFEWANNGNELVQNAEKTDSIHAFNRVWGQWIKNEKVIKVYK